MQNKVSHKTFRIFADKYMRYEQEVSIKPPLHTEGSTVRGENTRKSDIDILIDFNAGQETYLNFMNACSILQSAFGKTKLDVVTKKGLSPYIGETILKEVEYV